MTGWMMCSYLVSISLIIQSWFCSCSAAHYDCHAALEEQVKGAAQLGCEEPVANRWTLYPHIGCRRKSLGYFGVKYKDSLSYIYVFIIEGSLEVKLPTIWTDEKQSRAEAERREILEERRVEEKESEERRYRCAKR